ncbi:MAG: rhodanese-like domain-containing protein [Planctomycetota bacterium]|jgi:rhodanese-related sulfurtransferase
MSDKKINNVNLSTAEELYKKIKDGKDVQILDVREVFEYEGKRIKCAILAPLSRFNESSKIFDRNRHSYIVCQAGKRAEQFAKRLLEKGYENISVLEGGLKAWIDAGYPIEEGENKLWSLERQVRFVAGLLVLLGVFLSLILNPAFLILSGIVGAGLVFAAVTDNCGMAMLLARMPWNKAPKKVSDE